MISTRAGGSQCPYCSGIKLLKGFNDLATTHPTIAEEWSELNYPLLLEQVNEKSTKNVWWKCKVCGNEWKAVINARVKDVSCPVCAERKVLKGYNDLATTDAVLCKEWDYEKNKVKPTEISRNSHNRAWWLCRYGHSWNAKICERTHEGKTCTVCESEFDSLLVQLLVSLYAKQYNMRVATYNQNLEPEKALEVLIGRDFVPCEVGEHAIADQYLFAHLAIGRNYLAQGEIESAFEVFKKGQELPQSLGAGIWNHCKLVPLKYFEAVCLEQLNRKPEADEIFNYIANIGIEYFSNMHLKELPYFQARAWQHLNQHTKGQQIITEYLREWRKIDDVKDNGFSSTTPFFIPFTDKPEKLRHAQYCYLMALCSDYMGEKETAKALIKESLCLNNENLFALTFDVQGF